jgi:hypothetical protein
MACRAATLWILGKNLPVTSDEILLSYALTFRTHHAGVDTSAFRHLGCGTSDPCLKLAHSGKSLLYQIPSESVEGQT